MAIKFHKSSDSLICKICKDPATVILAHGNQYKRYPLCEHHQQRVIYPVRVFEVGQTKRLRYDGKARKNVIVKEKNKSLLFVDLRFDEVAVESEGRLILLENGGYVGLTNRTVCPDNRNAVDFLLDHPPINANGKVYKTFKAKTRKPFPCSTKELRLSNNKMRYEESNSIKLADLYHKLTQWKATEIHRLTENKIAVVR